MMRSVRIQLQLKFAKSSAVGESVCGGGSKGSGVFFLAQIRLRAMIGLVACEGKGVHEF